MRPATLQRHRVIILLMVMALGGRLGTAQTSMVAIGPGDLLEVSVLGVDELSRKVRVLGDGTITLPLLGNFRVQGFSVTEAEALIGRMLASKELVNDPEVSLFVAETVSGAVSVQGAVRSPGTYELLGSSTLLEILGRAGGVTQDRGAKILVVRGADSTEQQTIDVDAQRLIDMGDASLNLPLQPGDIVVVPAARTLRVYVTGAVQRPGAVEFSSSEGITVLQAITAAGGPTERANLKKVKVNRREADGTEELILVNVKKIQKGKEPDLPLQRNDTVVVGEWLL